MKRFAVSALALLMLLSAGCKKEETAAAPSEEQVVEPIEASPSPTPSVTPSPEPESSYIFPYETKLEEAEAENPDVVGYICIPGTNIDYPILYGQGWFYQTHDIKMSKNNVGSVYSHFTMPLYEELGVDQNLVIAAANARTSRTLFHELHHVQEVNLGETNCAYKQCHAALDKATLPDFSTEEGRIWDIAICGIEARWEIWAMYEAGGDRMVYYNTWFPSVNKKTGRYDYVPQGEEEIQRWIDRQLKASQYDFGVEVSPSDQFLTIYTSGDDHDSSEDSSRLYFFLKQVEPKTEKTFPRAAAEQTEAQ